MIYRLNIIKFSEYSHRMSIFKSKRALIFKENKQLSLRKIQLNKILNNIYYS